MSFLQIWVSILFIAQATIWLYTSIQTNKITLRYVKKGPFKVWSSMTTDEKREVKRLTKIAVVSFIIMLCLVLATFFINSRLSAE